MLGVMGVAVVVLVDVGQVAHWDVEQVVKAVVLPVGWVV